MKKFEYDILLGDNKFYTHYISEQHLENVAMRNMHNHSHYEILYILGGERVLIAEKKQYTLNKNSVALVPPYTLHRTTASGKDTNNRYKKYMINFTKDFIRNFSAIANPDTELDPLEFKARAYVLRGIVQLDGEDKPIKTY